MNPLEAANNFEKIEFASTQIFGENTNVNIVRHKRINFKLLIAGLIIGVFVSVLASQNFNFNKTKVKEEK